MVIRPIAGASGVLLLVTLAACSAPSPEPIELPDGFAASQVLTIGDDLVIGGSVGDAPALLAMEPDAASPREVAVEPGSFYGALALWTSIVADDGALVALGGRTGGGHGNPRWSTWAGDLDGLVEQPEQGREVFGGWRGGGLAGMSVVDGAPYIVGSRTGAHPGLDIAVWHYDGGDWIEQPSTGTALAATDDALPFPTSVTSLGGELLITGYLQVLGGGTVANRAAVWIGAPDGPFERLDLASLGDVASAHAASCDAERCVVVGEDDGMLAAWRIADGTATALTVPELELDADVPAPIVDGARVAIVVPTGDATTLLVNAGDGWTTATLPGTPVAAAGWDGGVVVVDSEGAVRRARVSLAP